MSEITFKGNTINTCGELPKTNTSLKDFNLVTKDLKERKLEDYKGKKLVLNIFPSVDTGVCATSVREFNKNVANKENTVVLCVSKDLPFAQNRFCAAEGIENVEMLSAFRSSFGEDFGVTMTDGPLKGLLSRAVIVVNENGEVVYTEQVREVTEEPDYKVALSKV
ncbi:thiol peroxidase [Weeksellaceae bacterium TAE3-ERU29]|nr:thiol peroxidase [Weeksellaceae bacterium TAE3-ERU29]